MKKHLFTAFIFLFIQQVLGQSFSNPVEYMNTIGDYYSQIKNDTWDYTRTVAHNKGGSKIEKKRLDLLSTISEAKKTVSKLPAFEGDKSYRDSVVSYLDINYDVLNNDYAKIVDMEKIAEQSYDLMEAYLLAQDMANDRLKLAANNLQESQQTFANKFNITLEEDSDETTKKLEEADEMYKYYNKAYLLFFKSYKQEAYLIDAYSRADISAMEQNKNQLLEYSNDGLKILRSMSAYRGDHTLLDRVINILVFYQDEAGIHAPKQIDFYLKKERFENVKKALDAKSENKRTKEDIDKYNKSLTEYNDSIKEFNTINNELNGKRTELYTAWNKTCQEFTSTHVQKR